MPPKLIRGREAARAHSEDDDAEADLLPASKKRSAADLAIDPRKGRAIEKAAAAGPHAHGHADAKSKVQAATLDAVPSPYEAVIKVFAVHCEPNFRRERGERAANPPSRPSHALDGSSCSLPWQRKRQFSSSSSGFIIPGRRILTNAHCVADHTQVKVKRRGSDMKYGECREVYKTQISCY